MSYSINQICEKSFSRPFYIEATYSIIISAYSGSDQTSAVSCKYVVRVPWFLFLLAIDTTIPGGLMMVKLGATVQVTLLSWCYLLALNTFYRPSASSVVYN